MPDDGRPQFFFIIFTNKLDAKSEDSLNEFFDIAFLRYEKKYGKYPYVKALPQRFENSLENIYEKTGHKVTVLIDEYDAPLLNTLGRHVAYA